MTQERHFPSSLQPSSTMAWVVQSWVAHVGVARPRACFVETFAGGGGGNDGAALGLTGDGNDDGAALGPVEVPPRLSSHPTSETASATHIADVDRTI